MYNKGLFDFLNKKINLTSTTEAGYQPVMQRNSIEIEYYEMEASKATCPGISTTSPPSKTYEVAKPKRLKFTSMVMYFFKKSV